MRISVLQDYLRRGGTERQSVLLCKTFLASHLDASLLTLRPGGPLDDFARRAGVVHESLTKRDFGINAFAPGLGRTLESRQPDIVLCMGRVANSYAGWLRSRLPETQIVGTVRTGKRLPLLNWRSFRRLSCVIANTKWWKDQLVARGLEANKVHVIPNGLGFDWQFPQRPAQRVETRRRLGIEDTEVVLINVAGFRPGKRHKRLLELMAKLPLTLHWSALLVGDGPTRTECEAAAKSLGIADRVRFIGAVADPFDYYASADIALSCSTEDALPNFLIEAQWMGLPVVASHYQGVSEAIAPEGGFMVEPDSPLDFVTKLNRLAQSPETRTQMSECARQRALELFDAKEQGAAYLQVFESLINHAH